MTKLRGYVVTSVDSKGVRRTTHLTGTSFTNALDKAKAMISKAELKFIDSFDVQIIDVSQETKTFLQRHNPDQSVAITPNNTKLLVSSRNVDEYYAQDLVEKDSDFWDTMLKDLREPTPVNFYGTYGEVAKSWDLDSGKTYIVFRPLNEEGFKLVTRLAGCHITAKEENASNE